MKRSFGMGRRVGVVAVVVLQFLALSAALLTVALASPAAGSRSPQAPSKSAGAFFGHFDGMRLADQNGRAFDPSALAGRIVLVNFVYTGCSSVCPVQTHALAELQRALPAATRRQVRWLSVSIDPLQDTPEALKRFAQRMGADLADWTFATGRPQDIERLTASLRLLGNRPDARLPDDHAASLWLVDGQGRLVQRYSGNPPDVPRLIAELQQLDRMSLGATAMR